MARPPPVSVAIPTYRRPALLRRAVGSVLAQTAPDWELVVSDDEPAPGEAWAYLEGLARRNARVRIVRNAREPGEWGNTSTALLACGAPWIKILHDDDRLLPRCLEHLLGLAARFPGAACVTCAAHTERAAGAVAPYRRLNWPLLEVLEGRDVPRALSLLENVGWVAPSHLMVRADTVAAGILPEAVPGLRFVNDTWYSARLGRHGDRVIAREPLLVYDASPHPSMSSAAPRAEHDREASVMLGLVRTLVDDPAKLPPLATTRAALRLVQAVYAARRGERRQALATFAAVRHPGAYLELARHLAHLASGGAVARVRRRRPAG